MKLIQYQWAQTLYWFAFKNFEPVRFSHNLMLGPENALSKDPKKRRVVLEEMVEVDNLKTFNG